MPQPQLVAEGLHLDVLAGRDVGQHHVELVERQGGEELGERPLAADQGEVRDGVHRRLQQERGQALGDDVGHPGDQAHPLPGGQPLDRQLQLAPGAEDVVGVLEDGAPGVGEDQPAPLPLQQLHPQGALQGLQLVGDGGLGEPQLLARLGDGARPGHGPEVVEVVVVEPLHGRRKI
jgi:hypothetical protein